MKKTALIMAGGRGERFWPKSRVNLPKQFLSLTGDGKTMIQLTVERILPLVDIEDIFVATNRNYKKLLMEQIPEIPEENILCEPIGRNTAPCIGLGAVHIAKKYGDAVMFVLPSDHLITHPQIFRRSLADAAEVAEQGSNLVTIGITPTYPETGYGYIKIHPEETAGAAFAVTDQRSHWDRGSRKCAGKGIPGLQVRIHRLRSDGKSQEYLYSQRFFRLGRCGFLACAGANAAAK